MNSNSIKAINLETHQTKDIRDNHVNGSLTVVWRDWDKIMDDDPKMVYVSYVDPGEIKGPHLHTKRDSYFVCVLGKVVFIIREDDGKYHEIISSEDHPVLLQIPKNYPSAHINLSNSRSAVLALANHAWKPGDNEMINVVFDDYDWGKWNQSRK